MAKRIITIIKILIFLVLLTPLLSGGSALSPFNFWKSIYLRGIIEIILALYFYLILTDRKYIPRPSLLLWALLVFAGVLFFSAVGGVNFTHSFLGDSSRADGIILILHLLALFAIINAVFDASQKEHFLKFLVGVGFIEILAGLGQKLSILSFSGLKIYGTIGNPALFAGFVLIIIFLALTFGLKRERVGRAWYFTVAVSGALALLLTAVRGSFIGLLAGLLTFFALIIFNVSRRKIIYVCGGIFLTIAVLFFAFRGSPVIKNNGYLQRLSDISIQSGTVQSRLKGWDMAIAGWKERPFLGWGYMNFYAVFNRHFNPLLFNDSQSENYWDRAHNVFFEYLATTGIAGVLALFALTLAVFYLFLKVYRKDKLWGIGLFSTAVAYGIHDLFIFDSLTSYLALMIVLAFASGYRDVTIQTKPSIPHNALSTRAVLGISLIIFLPAFYFFSIRPIVSNAALNSAESEFKIGRYAEAKLSFERAITYGDSFGPEIRKKLGADLINRLDLASKISNEDLGKILSFGEAELFKNIQEDPNDMISYVELGYVLNIEGKLGNTEKYNSAEAVLNEGLTLFPTRQQLYYRLAETKWGQSKKQESMALLERALELNSASSESLWRLGLLRYANGDKTVGLDLIEKAVARGYPYGSYLGDTLRLINVYAAEKNYGKVEYLYRTKALKLEPQSAQLHASLAATYKVLGNKEGALSEAQKAVELDPSFAHDEEIFIQSLR